MKENDKVKKELVETMQLGKFCQFDYGLSEASVKVQAISSVVGDYLTDGISAWFMKKNHRSIRYPRDWWEAFKYRFIPVWLRYRFCPVIMRHVVVTHVCPHWNKDWKEHIDFIGGPQREEAWEADEFHDIEKEEENWPSGLRGKI